MINIFNHSKLLSTCALFLLVQNHLIVSHLSISCSDYIKFDFDQLEIVKNCFYNFIVWFCLVIKIPTSCTKSLSSYPILY